MLTILLIVVVIILVLNYVPVGNVNLGGNNIVGIVLGILLIYLLLRVLGVV